MAIRSRTMYWTAVSQSGQRTAWAGCSSRAGRKETPPGDPTGEDARREWRSPGYRRAHRPEPGGRRPRRRVRRQGIPWRRRTLAFLITLIPACEQRQILHRSAPQRASSTATSEPTAVAVPGCRSVALFRGVVSAQGQATILRQLRIRWPGRCCSPCWAPSMTRAPVRIGVPRTAHAARRGHWCWQSREAGAPERCLTAGHCP